jgi:transcriptional regulator with XRE-family HTH domain
MTQQYEQTQHQGARQRNAPIFDMAKLAERIYQLRHRQHWTQQALGDRAGVHYVTISKLEKQILPGVSADTIARLARTFGVSTDFLLGLTDEDAEKPPPVANGGSGRQREQG